MDTQVYLIKPFTNMHVGSGKENAGIVDNTIQRDVLTTLPVINSTSLKGALREYAMKYFPGKVEFVFGSGNEKKEGKENDMKANIPGKYIFYSAHLLSIPARSDKFSFLNATCPQIVCDFLKQVTLLGNIIDDKILKAFKELLSISLDNGVKAVCFEEAIEGSIVEFYDVKASLRNISKESLDILRNWLGDNFVWVDSNILKENITNKLPVIARNNLENGQSTNLWYEEIIPRETIFYTFISAPKEKWVIKFDKLIVQIGANASVGYGFSEMYKPERNIGEYNHD
jgi:CRISPR-associated protein Cmr4